MKMSNMLNQNLRKKECGGYKSKISWLRYRCRICEVCKSSDIGNHEY